MRLSYRCLSLMISRRAYLFFSFCGTSLTPRADELAGFVNSSPPLIVKPSVLVIRSVFLPPLCSSCWLIYSVSNGVFYFRRSRSRSPPLLGDGLLPRCDTSILADEILDSSSSSSSSSCTSFIFNDWSYLILAGTASSEVYESSTLISCC